MQQVFRYGLTGIFLLIGTWQDMKTRKIGMQWIILFGTAGMIMNIVFHSPWHIWFSGIMPGIVILIFGKLTGEQIGYGDGLIVIVTGLFLSGRENVSLFLIGLFLCAVSTTALFFTGKITRRTTLPFVPFLAVAFLIQALSLSVR